MQGLVYKDRPEGGLTPQKLEFARSPEEGERFRGAEDFGISDIGPTALIGAAARRSTFSKSVLEALVQVSCRTRLSCRKASRIFLTLGRQRCSARRHVAAPSKEVLEALVKVRQHQMIFNG